MVASHRESAEAARVGLPLNTTAFPANRRIAQCYGAYNSPAPLLALEKSLGQRCVPTEAPTALGVVALSRGRQNLQTSFSLLQEAPGARGESYA